MFQPLLSWSRTRVCWPAGNWMVWVMDRIFGTHRKNEAFQLGNRGKRALTGEAGAETATRGHSAGW
jgi:hypothetical protein